ncbi:MAG: NTPase, partial [Bacteroidota bacterium]
MSAEFYLLSVPVQCGKTTMLESWVSAQPLGSIGGCLSPDRRDEKGQKNRVFFEIETGIDIPFECKKSELIDSRDLLEIGRFRFRQSGFDWVQAQLKKWAENVDLKTLVIDEI